MHFLTQPQVGWSLDNNIDIFVCNFIVYTTLKTILYKQTYNDDHIHGYTCNGQIQLEMVINKTKNTSTHLFLMIKQRVN